LRLRRHFRPADVDLRARFSRGRNAREARKIRVAKVGEIATPAHARHTTSADFLQIVEIWLECSQQAALNLSSGRNAKTDFLMTCSATCEQEETHITVPATQTGEIQCWLT
jgi:hypothetical protein